MASFYKDISICLKTIAGFFTGAEKVRMKYGFMQKRV